VAEVASIGGFVQQYQVTVDPNRLRAFDLGIMAVAEAVRSSNSEVGGRLLEFAGREFMVRGRGYVKSKTDLEQVVLKTDQRGTPVLLRDVASVALGPEMRRGIADLDGLEVNRAHQLVVLPTLQTTLDPDIFALGDCAACPWPEAGKPGALIPPRAQAAHQQASLLVRTISARLDGRPLPVFRFRDFGSLVSLGQLSAVGSLMGRLIGGSMLIQGLIARGMYASLYKLHQVSLHGYCHVALDTLGRFLRRRLEPRVKLH